MIDTLTRSVWRLRLCEASEKSEVSWSYDVLWSILLKMVRKL